MQKQKKTHICEKPRMSIYNWVEIQLIWGGILCVAVMVVAVLVDGLIVTAMVLQAVVLMLGVAFALGLWLQVGG